MRQWILTSVFASMLSVFTSTSAHAEVICVGPGDQIDCEELGPEECLQTAQSKCLGHGGLSSYSCTTCFYHEDPMFGADLDEEAKTLNECIPTGGTGWYLQLEYYCNGN